MVRKSFFYIIKSSDWILLASSFILYFLFIKCDLHLFLIFAFLFTLSSLLLFYFIVLFFVIMELINSNKSPNDCGFTLQIFLLNAGLYIQIKFFYLCFCCHTFTVKTQNITKYFCLGSSLNMTSHPVELTYQQFVIKV